MAVKIPQDVTREDRLVGPLTLRQFLYVLIGGGTIFAAWQGYVTFYLFFYEFLLISFVVGTLAAALAFAKINGQSFIAFLSHLYGFLLSPKKILWHKSPRADLPAIRIKANDLKDTKTELAERKAGKVTETEIEKLASVLDAGGTIKAEQKGIISGPINNLNFETPGSQINDFDVEDILADTD